MPNRILIVDDNPAVRAGIRSQFKNTSVEICGEAIDGLDALDKAADLRPDLIVLDLSMPRMNGIDAARELKRICPGAPVILHTLYADVVRSKGALPEGVSAVVGKGDNLKERVLATIQRD